MLLVCVCVGWVEFKDSVTLVPMLDAIAQSSGLAVNPGTNQFTVVSFPDVSEWCKVSAIIIALSRIKSTKIFALGNRWKCTCN